MTNLMTAILLLRLFAASQLLLSAIALATSPNPYRVRLIGVALALGGISYLISSPVFDSINLSIGLGLGLPADAIPPLLLLFTWELFEDDRRLSPLVWFIVATYIVMTLLIGLTGDAIDPAVRAYLLVPLQLIKLGFVVGAIFIVWTGRESDLVETRLKLRRAFAASIAVVVAVVVATELITRWQVPEAVELVGMAAIFVVTLAINLTFLRLNPTFALTGPPRSSMMMPEENLLVGELKRTMSGDRAYADHDLRIADLSSRLKVPEYQLRRTINQNLGYRNFNQFVNRYRIEEAARRLIDEPRTPVLTIALDVGFRSISSFNTAFRAQYRITPTVYRKSKQTDS